MAEQGEYESFQDKTIQGTRTEGFLCINDVTVSDTVNVIDTRTKVSVHMSDATTSRQCPGQKQQSCSTGIKAAQKTLPYQAYNALSTSQSEENMLKTGSEFSSSSRIC